MESGLSDVVFAIPERVIAYPALVDKNCFIENLDIHSDKELDQIRAYRDEVLNTNLVGELLVELYYFASPLMTALVDGNPMLKNISIRIFSTIFPVALHLDNACLFILFFVNYYFFAIYFLCSHLLDGVTMIRFLVFSTVFVLSVSLASAEMKRPDIRWTTETKLGFFQPDLANWAEYYGSQYSPMGSQLIAYRVLHFLEIGLDGSYVYSKGQGDLPLNNMRGGEVTLAYYPLSINLTLRGRIFSQQWVVPYIGAGIRQLIYVQKITEQETVNGYVGQNYIRIGMQFLLNHFDPVFHHTSADSQYKNFHQKIAVK